MTGVLAGVAPASERTRGSVQSELARRLGAPQEARWLVEEVLGHSAPSGARVNEPQAARLSAMAERRLAGEPLQYVLGRWAFRTLDFLVDDRALVPRPETEQVVEVAISELRRVAECRTVSAETPDAPGEPSRGPLVADLGTGTGAIALSIASEVGTELPGLCVWATDAAAAALSLAGENRAQLGAARPGATGRVVLAEGSWFEALPPDIAGRLDLVVSNPPYVSEGEWPSLDPEVRREPRLALVAGAASDGTPGMAAVEAVVSGALGWLHPDGAVVVELAPHQAGPAAAVALRAGYGSVRVERDLAGRDRVLVARR